MPDFDASLFEETQISPAITLDDAVIFFKEHGIFYHADADIAEQVERFGIQTIRDPQFLKRFQFKDPRLERILQSHEPAHTFVLGCHKGAFYCFAVKPDDPRANQVLVYIWTKATRLEFFPEIHTAPLRGVLGANGLYQVPYSWCREKSWIEDEEERRSLKETLKEIPIEMDGGGVLIVHPRMAFSVENGFAVAYGCNSKYTEGPHALR